MCTRSEKTISLKSSVKVLPGFCNFSLSIFKTNDGNRTYGDLARRHRPLPTREYDVEEGGGGDRACRMDDREVVARQGLVLQLVSHVLTLLRSVWGGGGLGGTGQTVTRPHSSYVSMRGGGQALI